MDITTTIIEFGHNLTAKGYAPDTVLSYNWGLGHFKRWLDERGLSNLRKITKQSIDEYRHAVMSCGMAMESKAIRIRSIKRLFEYLTESNQLLINPTEGIVETCRRHRKVGIVLTKDEVDKILAQPNLSMPIQIRDRTIMELLYSTGIRLNELINLEIYHVEFKEGVLFIRKGKGKRQRVVPTGDDAIKYIREYMEKIRPRYAKMRPKERRVFLSKSGFPLTKGSVNALLRKYRFDAKLEKPVSAHTFRRTCATHMLQNGADIRYVQKLLGHKYLKTTQNYTKVIPVDVKKTHNATHPNGKKGKKS